MILSPQDKDLYFPSVCAEGASLLGLIRVTEGIAQGIDGSSRFLEITEYSEEKALSVYDRSVRLIHYPIVESSLEVSIVRVSGTDSFGRRVALADRTLLPADYSIEDSTLYINNPQFIHKIRVKYRAGFDFDEETPDTITIKSAMGALLEYRASFAGQGLMRHDGLGLSLNSKPVGENPENIMQIFRQYRCRG